MDSDSVSLALERVVRVDERLGRLPLQERARLGIERLAKKIIVGCVADVELDRGIEPAHLDEVGIFLGILLDRRRGELGGSGELGDRRDRPDPPRPDSAPGRLGNATFAAVRPVTRPAASRSNTNVSPE